MKFYIKLDKKKLDAKIKAVAESASKVIPAIGTQAVSLAERTFRAQSNPEGEPWESLKKDRPQDLRARAKVLARGGKPRGGKILIDTGKLRKSIHFKQIYEGANIVSIIADVPYASFHQDGTKRIPQRGFFPTKRGELPASWRSSFAQVALIEISKLLGQK